MTEMIEPGLETMAIALESHEDYRVLRRFKPRQRYQDGAVPEAQRGHGVLVDTETTGKDPMSDRVIELGLVSFTFDKESGAPIEVTGSYNALEDPGIPINPDALRVHGITDAMVRGQRIDDSRVEQLVEAADIVIAHNAGFDREFCERRWPTFERVPWSCSRTQIDWASELITGTKLDYIASRLGFFYDAHRAEQDCFALLEILARVLPSSGAPGLKQLFAQFQAKELRLWATDSPFERKGMLSARGYKWGDGTQGKEKAWFTTLAEEKLDEEIAWLRAHIYGRPGRVVIDRVDAYSRFSPRRIGTQMMRFV